MNNRKWYKISGFVALCIILNFCGKGISSCFQLPLWLDSIGTVFASYTLGPISASIIGVCCDFIYSIICGKIYLIYVINTIAIAYVVGYLSKKGFINSVFGVFSTSFALTVVSIIIRTCISYAFFEGNIGNIWANGIVSLLINLRVTEVVSHIIGEFYVEFFDKVITVLILYFSVKIYRKYRDKKIQANSIIKNVKIIALLFIISFNYLIPSNIYAKNIKDIDEKIDFNTYIQTVYNNKNEFIAGVANDIAQTYDGVLWIATYSGLYRYSGSSFVFMKNFENIKNVNCLYTDKLGRLLIGTNDSGLAISIDEQIVNFIDTALGLPSDSVRGITECSDGNYYVGTSESLAILNLSDKLSVKSVIPEIIYTTSICSDKKGNVAVVTNNGTLYIVKDEKIKFKLKKDDINFSCCSFDEVGNLYVGTTKDEIEIYSIDNSELKKKFSIKCKDLFSIKSVNFTDIGYTFVCADNGIGFFDKDFNYKKINTNTFNSSIDGGLVDYQGNIWFSSSRLGLLRLNKSIFSEIYGNMGLKENVTNSVTEWNNLLYIGKDNGLDVFNEEKTKVNNILSEYFQETRIRCLKVDSKNCLWICTTGKGAFQILEDGTINRYDVSTGAVGDKFRNMIELKNGKIVIAGDYGVSIIKDNKIIKNITREDGMKISKTLCVLENDDGNIFVGTDGGGVSVINDDKVVHTYTKEEGLGSEVILRIVKDSTDDGYFIVTSNSLCYLENNKIRVLDNFPYYNNYDVIEGNQNNLFVLSSAGIYVVDKEKLLNGNKLDYELLNAKKGLQRSLTPNSWNYLDKNNNLYLACDSGIVSLNIDKYSSVSRSYRSMVKFIKADGINYPVDRGEITYLPKGTNVIEITPEIINYSLNDPYVSVWLEGFEDKPKVLLQSQLSTITYTNLPVKEYTFHFAVLDSKGSENVTEYIYKFEEEKDIYNHWWFILYFICVFSLAIVYVSWNLFRKRIQTTINMQKRELELTKKQLLMGDETILTIAKTVDARDDNTSQHSVRVSEYSVLIAKKLGYSKEKCEELRKTALLHDIGKIGIPDSILKKPAKLTDEEYTIMKSHVTKGAEILKGFTIVENVAEGALYHHERYDGKGYVNGLKGEEIPLNARIIGIADAFDAMTANRVYRNKLDLSVVIEELKRCKGTQFDPNLVDIMLKLIETGSIDVKRIYDDAK